MAVRFVIGRAGTGKTRRCVGALAEALREAPLGGALLWIVPEQATFQAQRALLMAPGVKGAFRAQVLGFRRLTRLLAGELGLDGGTELDDLARAVLLGDLVAGVRGELEVFGAVADRPGFVERLDGMLMELQQCGHTGASLRALAEKVGGETTSTRSSEGTKDHEGEGGGGETDRVLAGKLRDLGRLLDAWDGALVERNLSSERMAARVAERVGESQMVAGARVWIDAFSAFNVLEMRLIAELARHAREVEITVLADGASPVWRDPTARLDETSLFYRTERMVRLLQREFARQGISPGRHVILDEVGAAAITRRFAATPGLGLLEQRLFTPGRRVAKPAAVSASAEANEELLDPGLSGRSAGGGAIELWECASPSAEVHAAAQKIRELVGEGRGGGAYRYRDIGLIIPALEDYADAVRRIFAQHHIPHFIDQRRSISHHPLIEFLRSAIAWVLRGYLADDLALLLKTGLTTIAEGESQRLENYLLAHGIGRCDLSVRFGVIGLDSQEEEPEEDEGTDDALLASQRAQLAMLNGTREQLRAWLGPWVDLARRAMSGEAGVGGDALTRGLYDLLVRCGVAGRMETLMETARAGQDQELLMIHQQAWRQTMGLFETLERILHGRTRATTLEDFSRIVAGALESLSLGLIPPTLDQVLVSSVTRSRHPELKVAVILGASENRFPLLRGEDPLLNDHQRAMFNGKVAASEEAEGEGKSPRGKGKGKAAAGAITPGSDRLLLEAQFYDYVAFTRASERLIVSYPLADEQGRALGQSAYVGRLRRVFSQLRARVIDGEQLHDLTALATWDDALAATLSWGRQTMLRGAQEGEDGERWRMHAAVYDWLVGPQSPEVQRAVERVWRSLLPEAVPRLSAELAGRFWGDQIRMSVSQLEGYAACPLQYFLHYALRLQPRATLELDGLQAGTLYHRILERVYDQVIAGRVKWPGCGPEVMKGIVNEAVESSAAELHAELAAQLPGYAKMRERTKKTLGIVVESQRRAAAAGDLRPVATELVFGMPADEPGKIRLPAYEIETGDRRRALLRGKIDRVDVTERGNRCVVVDYKSGRPKALDLYRIYHGLQLQLPVYLLVLGGQTLRLGHGQAGPLRAIGAFFAPLGISRTSQGDLSKLADPDDDAFFQAYKPRGMIDADAIRHLDAAINDEDERNSPWYRYKRTLQTGGRLGHLAKTGNDALETPEFDLVLKFVRWRIARLVEELTDGQIAPVPFRDGTKTPCSYCEYAGMCGFDRARGAYRHVVHLKRAEALVQMQAAMTHKNGPLPAPLQDETTDETEPPDEGDESGAPW